MLSREEALSMCKIQYCDLPECCRGMTIELSPVRFKIVVNERYAPDHQRFTLEHELAHIRLGHFHRQQTPLSVCERGCFERSGYATYCRAATADP